jgi:hypothetical protein
MKLGELAFACYIYGRMSDYDSSYRRLVDATRPRLDLRSKQHLLALLKWLNEWGCRQFAKEHHDLAAQEIGEWHKEIGHKLFHTDKTLLSLTDDDFMLVEQAYVGLIGKTASYRNSSKGRKVRVEVGPTGAAKILFALRPNALIPWDDPIREELRLDGSAHSYRVYLGIAKDYLDGLTQACKENGFELTDLPAVLGRAESSVAKLMDEFFWVTISRKCPAPSGVELKRWVSWS